MLATANVQPGDILAVRTGNSFPARMIRLGAAVKEAVTGDPEPNTVNHVAIVTHADANGVLWALEGRPGGIGWVQAASYVSDPYTVSNVLQPKTAAQRTAIVADARKLIGTAYDWAAIADDAANAFGINVPGWNPQFGKVPGHLVCSSYAAYLYAQAGLAHPSGDRNVSPADWVTFILSHNWEG